MMSDNLSVADVTATVQEAVAGACTYELNILKPPRVVDAKTSIIMILLY